MSGQQGNNKECEKVVYFKRPPDLEHSFIWRSFKIQLEK